jgi:hypothetical protein
MDFLRGQYVIYGSVRIILTEGDYTEWITRSFFNKVKEGGHVRITGISYEEGIINEHRFLS